MTFDPVQFKACLVEMREGRLETLRWFSDRRTESNGEIEPTVDDVFFEASASREADFLGELITAMEASTK